MITDHIISLESIANMLSENTILFCAYVRKEKKMDLLYFSKDFDFIMIKSDDNKFKFFINDKEVLEEIKKYLILVF